MYIPAIKTLRENYSYYKASGLIDASGKKKRVTIKVDNISLVKNRITPESRYGIFIHSIIISMNLNLSGSFYGRFKSI